MMFSKILAATTLLAAELHKGSFCKKCYNNAIKEGEAKAKADPTNAESYKPNPEDFYHVSIPAASHIATILNRIPGSQEPIELMLTNSWEESVAWAKGIMEPEESNIPPEVEAVLDKLFQGIFGKRD